MRPLFAWVVFLLGDAVSRVMNIADWLAFLYPLYSRLMGWSDTIQGPSDRGPWSAVLASGTLTEGGDAKQAPGYSLSGPVAKPDAQ